LRICNATWIFDRIGADGDAHSADDIQALTLSNLNGEFAAIVTTEDVIAARTCDLRSV